MKVKVNIINTWCILMSDTVTMPSLMMVTVIVSEDSLARDRQTDRHNTHMHAHTCTHAHELHTHKHGVVYSKLFKVA